MERRLSPPRVAWEPSTEAPNSLQSNSHAGGLRSSYAETKQGQVSRNNPQMTRMHNAHEEAAKRWVSDSTPPSSSKRKRPVHHPLGLPSLASPLASGTNHHSNSSPQQQQQRQTKIQSRIPQSDDSPPSAASSGESDSLFLNAQKSALQCVDHASKRQAAAKAALTATSKISSSLKDLMGDSNRALSVARQSRIEAENSAVRAEGAAKKVKEASDVVVKDNQRASLELDEANAQAEEAWEFLRRVKGTPKGKKQEQDGQLKTKKKSPISSARIGTIVEVCENSAETNCSSVVNPLSPRKKAGNPLSHAEPKKLKSENTTSAGPVHWGNLSQSLPTEPGVATSKRDSLIEPIRKFKGHSSPVTQIARIDHNRFLSSSWDTTIRMWNADTGECIRTFRGHSDWVHAVSVLDSKHFISGSDDRSIKIWNVDKDECIRTYTGHSSFVKALAPMGGGRFLSGSRDRTIKLFSVASGECLQTFEGHIDVVSAIVALDSNHFASGSHDNNIKYWNDSSGTCVRTLVGHTGSIKTLATVSDKEIVSGSDDRTIRLWNVSTGKCLREFGSKNALVFSVTYICEGFFLSCGGNNIKLYHIPSGKCVKSYETPRISLAVVRLDDERFVTGSDQMLHMWRF